MLLSYSQFACPPPLHCTRYSPSVTVTWALVALRGSSCIFTDHLHPAAPRVSIGPPCPIHAASSIPFLAVPVASLSTQRAQRYCACAGACTLLATALSADVSIVPEENAGLGLVRPVLGERCHSAAQRCLFRYLPWAAGRRYIRRYVLAVECAVGNPFMYERSHVRGGRTTDGQKAGGARMEGGRTTNQGRYE
jgi:hypothetical protein